VGTPLLPHQLCLLCWNTYTHARTGKLSLADAAGCRLQAVRCAVQPVSSHSMQRRKTSSSYHARADEVARHTTSGRADSHCARVRGGGHDVGATRSHHTTRATPAARGSPRPAGLLQRAGSGESPMSVNVEILQAISYGEIPAVLQTAGLLILSRNVRHRLPFGRLFAFVEPQQ
jgi:hypothetical protein